MPPVRKLYHAVERHDQPADKRLTAAWASWDILYANGVIPCHLWEYPRTSKSIGDPRALPYLKDVLQPALDQASDDDIVFFTNDDNNLHSDLPEMLMYHCSVYGPCSSQRCEFKGRPIPPLGTSPATIARLARHHMGRDLFAATKSWWVSHLHVDEIGDPILGASAWDLHLCCIVRHHYGITSTRRNIEEHIFPAEIPIGYVLHKFHSPRWSSPGNERSPSEMHNKNQFKAWSQLHMAGLKFNLGNEI